MSAFVAADDRRLPSSGHNPPYWSGVVRVNEALQKPYGQLNPGSVAPTGAIAVEAHYDLSGAPQNLYAMEKREPGFDPPGGDWEYVVMNASGDVESRGALSFCARCHAESPHDHLFGPRLSARRHIQSSAGEGEGPTEADEDSGAAPDESALPAGSKPDKGDRPRKKRKK